MYRIFHRLREKEKPPPLGRREGLGEKGGERGQNAPEIFGDLLRGGEQMGKEPVKVFLKMLRQNGTPQRP